MDVLREVNLADGLSTDASAPIPAWRGERLDVVWAIDVLHPLALASRPDGP